MAQHPEEGFLDRQAQVIEIDSLRLHPSFQNRPGTIVVPTGKRQSKFRQRGSCQKFSVGPTGRPAVSTSSLKGRRPVPPRQSPHFKVESRDGRTQTENRFSSG